MRRKGPFRATLCCLVAVLLGVWAGSGNAEVLTLAQGLGLASENNRLIKITKQQERISESDTLVARSFLLPSVDASASETILAYQPKAIFGTLIAPTSDKSFVSYSLGVQQLLYDFEGTIAKYKSSKAILDTKRIDTQRVRNLVALDFAVAYFDLLEADKMVLVAGKEVESVQSHLRDARNLYENGVITKNDLLQAEVRLSDAKQRLLTANNNRAVRASQLNTVLSRPLTTEVQVIDIAEAPPGSVMTERGKAWETALAQRPEMRIVDGTMKSLDFEETSRKAEYYPRFFAGASYDYTENRYMFHQGNASFLLGMTMNLFSGGRTRAEVLKIEYQKTQLQEQRARLADEIRLEVERNLLDLNNARERTRVTKDAAGQAEENLRINRVRYEEGVGTATEVLDAVTLLTIAETNYYRSIYDLRRAESAVLYSIGKDLSEVYK
ncbi:MAG: TolC family protein [Nitrospirae bacterium]|nr:TolC family protein [Nitrospirota bacterium]